MPLIPLILAAIAGAGAQTAPVAVAIASGPAPVALLELYTSEGCSSCPPGEKWFSGLEASDRLWRSIVPVAFHVDYWDYLGWKDPLGRRAHSDRQRQFASEWRNNTIYTPGFVLHGMEWKDRRRDLREVSRAKGGGVLRVEGVIPGELTVVFESDLEGKLVANVAILGSGITIDVKAGENTGRRLEHDFAVLEWKTGPVGPDGRARISFGARPPDHGSRRLAIAAWIEHEGSPVPIQAAGGWIDAP